MRATICVLLLASFSAILKGEKSDSSGDTVSLRSRIKRAEGKQIHNDDKKVDGKDRDTIKPGNVIKANDDKKPSSTDPKGKNAEKTKPDKNPNDKSHGKDEKTNHSGNSKENSQKIYMCRVKNCTSIKEYENSSKSSEEHGHGKSKEDNSKEGNNKEDNSKEDKSKEGNDQKEKGDKQNTEKEHKGGVRKQRNAQYTQSKVSEKKNAENEQKDSKKVLDLKKTGLDHKKNEKDKDHHASGEHHKNATNEVQCTKEGPCDLSLWTNWTSCSVTCGNGTQIRTRELLNCPIKKAAEKCAALNFTETQICNDGCCPVDCVMSPWTASGGCSVTCGSGQQTMVRTQVSEAVCGGKPCSAFPNSEVVACNPGTCPCPAGWTHLAPYCYISTGTRASYDGAVSTCAAIGGRVPIYRNQAEWDTCLNWAKPISATSFWIALRQPASQPPSFNFNWADGTSASNFPGHQYPWFQADPDNISSYQCSGCSGACAGECVTCVRAEITKNFGWMDDGCNPPNGWNAVCQMDQLAP